MPIDSVAPRNEIPWGPNLAPWVSRCLERLIDLPKHPTHSILREWTGLMVSRTTTASDRVDSFVTPWVLRSRVMCIPFDELGIVPHALVRLDRILCDSLKDILQKDSEVSKWVIHEEHQRMDQRMKALSSPQILWRLYMSFSTNNSLLNFAKAQDLANTKWLVSMYEILFSSTWFT